MLLISMPVLRKKAFESLWLGQQDECVSASSIRQTIDALRLIDYLTRGV
jgi:hypothetical protein